MDRCPNQALMSVLWSGDDDSSMDEGEDIRAVDSGVRLFGCLDVSKCVCRVSIAGRYFDRLDLVTYSHCQYLRHQYTRSVSAAGWWMRGEFRSEKAVWFR